jgi:hypothetical protein
MEESGVCKAPITVDHGFAIGIQAPRAAGEFER